MTDRVFPAGRRVHFDAFADVPDFAEHERVGGTAAQLRSILRDGLSRYGAVQVSELQVSRRQVADDTASVRIELTPTAATPVAWVAHEVLEALNKAAAAAVGFDNGVRPFTVHVPSAYAWASVLVTPVAAPLALMATLANLGARAAGTGLGFEVPRPFGFVVDESSITEGPLPPGSPPSSSSYLGRLFSLPNNVASSDPAHTGRTNAGIGREEAQAAAEDAARRGVPSLLPDWVAPVGIAAVAIVGLAAVGYAARGVADVAGEI